MRLRSSRPASLPTTFDHLSCTRFVAAASMIGRERIELRRQTSCTMRRHVDQRDDLVGDPRASASTTAGSASASIDRGNHPIGWRAPFASPTLRCGREEEHEVTATATPGDDGGGRRVGRRRGAVRRSDVGGGAVRLVMIHTRVRRWRAARRHPSRVMRPPLARGILGRRRSTRTAGHRHGHERTHHGHRTGRVHHHRVPRQPVQG